MEVISREAMGSGEEAATPQGSCWETETQNTK
jgi:hypothetical protein